MARLIACLRSGSSTSLCFNARLPRLRSNIPASISAWNKLRSASSINLPAATLSLSKLLGLSSISTIFSTTAAAVSCIWAMRCSTAITLILCLRCALILSRSFIMYWGVSFIGSRWSFSSWSDICRALNVGLKAKIARTRSIKMRSRVLLCLGIVGTLYAKHGF